MAKKNTTLGLLMERTLPNGKTQTRWFNDDILRKSKVARAQVAAEGWEKVIGKPIGVETPKATKPKKEKPETVEPEFETV